MPKKDYSKALDEFMDICNTGVSEFEQVWHDYMIRALVRKCVSILTRLSTPQESIECLKSVARADLLFLADSLRVTQYEVNKEFIEEADKCGKSGSLPLYDDLTQIIERVSAKHATIITHMDSILALIDILSNEGQEDALRASVEELCKKFHDQGDYDRTVGEQLIKFKNDWFPTREIAAENLFCGV